MKIKFESCSKNDSDTFDLRDLEKEFLLELVEGEPVSEAEEVFEKGFRALSILDPFSEFKNCNTFFFKMNDTSSLAIVADKNDCLIRKFLFSILPENKCPVVIEKKKAEPSLEM